MTASSAVRSLASISLSRWYVSTWSGMGTSRLPSALSRLDLPHPFGPIRPYRLQEQREGKVLAAPSESHLSIHLPAC